MTLDGPCPLNCGNFQNKNLCVFHFPKNRHLDQKNPGRLVDNRKKGLFSPPCINHKRNSGLCTSTEEAEHPRALAFQKLPSHHFRERSFRLSSSHSPSHFRLPDSDGGKIHVGGKSLFRSEIWAFYVWSEACPFCCRWAPGFPKHHIGKRHNSRCCCCRVIENVCSGDNLYLCNHYNYIYQTSLM